MKNFTRLLLMSLFIFLFSAMGKAQEQQLKAPEVQVANPNSKEKISKKAIKKIRVKKEDKDKDKDKASEGEDEDEAYDGPAQAEQFQFERTKNPYTGTVPSDKMLQAVMATKANKEIVANGTNGTNGALTLNWIERGPAGDSTGVSNGNTRANKGQTAGRIDAFMVDSSDATHKTVWIGGRGGGLWKTTDITAATPTWTLINDYMGNLSMAAITQDPTNYNIMYFCTGESYNEAGALRGNGVFKSTDHGVTWAQLPSTALYYYCTRILCDYQGNVYLGTKGTGLLRSKDGGATWTNITPSGSAPDVCDLEITSTATASRLHAVFGIFSTQSYRYTDISSTVSSGAGWIAPITPFPSYAGRAEIGVLGNVLYAAPSDPATQNVPTMYKSIDGGKNWAATAGQPASGWASGQGWYALTVVINPSNPNECIVGGLDQNKTTDGGATWTKISQWVGIGGTPGQYVHADQHKALWFDGGSKLLFACDGGIHFSADGGATIFDKNQNLRLKEFYSVAIHPTITNYFIAGAQDNGVHKLNGGAGISKSEEVTGGDGAIVGIDQNEPQYQYGSYVYNNYRRSTNGGATWTSVNLNVPTTASSGMFINPFDYANVDNLFYAAHNAGTYMRWTNPQTGTTGQLVTVTAFNGATVSAVTTSPYTSKRVFFGTNGGRIIQVDNADAATPVATNITGTGMVGYVNNVAVGANDQTLLACFSSYGVNNVWSTKDGGTTWTACDGNLPDMPVYWAVYNPNDNNRVYIATETGVWETSMLNGASTIWYAHSSFPTIRATMLKFRASDNTLAASAYGRGIWSTTVCATASVTSQPPASTTVCVGNPVTFGVTASGDGTLTYQWQVSTNGGTSWTTIAGATTPSYTFTAAAGDNGNKYRVYVGGSCGSTDTSAIATLTTTTITIGGAISPATINACAGNNSTTLTLSGNVGNIMRWESSTDGGTTWVPISNTTTTLIATNVTQTTLYRVVVQSVGCTAVNSANATINYIPTGIGPLFVSTDPGGVLCAGSPTRLTVNSATSATVLADNPPADRANGYITFNFRNNNAFAVTITDIAGVASSAGLGNATAYYNTTALTGNPNNISIANGWRLFGSANFVGTGTLTSQPMLSGLSLVVPPNTTYGIVLASTDPSGLAGKLAYSAVLGTPVSVGGCDIITNATIGWAGLLVPDAPTTAARFFVGSVTFSGTPTQVTSGTILWSPAAGLSSTSTNPVAASPAVTTAYSVSVTDANGCKGNASVNIVVNQPPAIVLQPTNSPVQCAGTVASFNIGATGSGTNGNILNYQWQVSTDGGATYNNLPAAAPYIGVNTNMLVINPIAATMNNNLYRCTVKGVCTPDAVSSGAILLVSPLPTITITPAGANCGGVAGISGLKLTASGATTLVWTPVTGLYTDANATTAYVAGTSTTTVYAAPTANTVYTVTGTNPVTGCSATASVTVNYTPTAPSVSPTSKTICLGDAAVPLTVTSALVPATQTFNSGTVAVAIADGPALPYPAGYVFPAATSTITAAGIPNGANVTGLSVRLNITHTYVSDLVIVLKAPNGKIFNLDAAATTSGKAGANFVNTVISSTGTTLLSAGATPGYTGTFAPDNVGATFTTSGFSFPGGPVGYVPTTTTFSDLYSTPNGVWTIAVYDYGQGDVGTITSWSVNITYGAPAAGIWSPLTGLYTDAGATTAYTGTALNTVYAKPAVSTNYKVTVATATCTSPAQTIPITVNTPIVITAQPVAAAVCADKVTSFTTTATGSVITHNWRVSTNTTAPYTWADITDGGVYSGAKTATLTITAPPVSMNGYLYKDSITTSPCTNPKPSDSAKLTVNPTPVINLTASPKKLFPGLTTIISATSSTTAATYTWLRNGVAVANATTSKLTVDVNGLGDYTVNVTDVNGCTGTSAVLSITDSSSGRFFIYPNPSNGQFEVRYYSAAGSTNVPRGINVYDARGKRVLTQKYSVSTPYARMAVDLRNYGSGVYWIELVDVSGNRIDVGRAEVLR